MDHTMRPEVSVEGLVVRGPSGYFIEASMTVEGEPYATMAQEIGADEAHDAEMVQVTYDKLMGTLMSIVTGCGIVTYDLTDMGVSYDV